MSGFDRNSRNFALALALGAGLSALPASAQPVPHHHGRGGMEGALVAMKTQLNLSPSQQTALDNAIASGKAAREAAKASRQTVHQLAKDEMAKAKPDFEKIATAEDQARDAAINARRGVRNQLLAVYATLSAPQVAIVKEAISLRMSRMDSFREHMRERFGKN